MVFIVILALVATMLAGSAAYFSVYGLAVTFSGAFWAVVIMGASLEAGKLTAASYLYRYWHRTGFLMKTYLIAGIIAVMGLTSVGVFGYLSAGYQAEILPLKQMQERMVVIEEDRTRIFERKRELDKQIADASITVNVNQSNGRIDPRAVAALRQAEASRKAQVATLKPEQESVTAQLAALDKEILELKTQRIHHEAKIGPIMYIADVFGLPPDNATKYLIFLIIFAFDPMAVVLTLAVNIALRLREEDKKKAELDPPVPPTTPEPQPPKKWTQEDLQAMIAEATVINMPVASPAPVPNATVDEPVSKPAEEAIEDTQLDQSIADPVVEQIDPHKLHIADTMGSDVMYPQQHVEEDTVNTQHSRPRVFSSLIPTDNEEKIRELLKYYREWKQIVDNGGSLSNDDWQEMQNIRRFISNTSWNHLLNEQ